MSIEHVLSEPLIGKKVLFLIDAYGCPLKMLLPRLSVQTFSIDQELLRYSRLNNPKPIIDWRISYQLTRQISIEVYEEKMIIYQKYHHKEKYTSDVILAWFTSLSYLPKITFSPYFLQEYNRDKKIIEKLQYKLTKEEKNVLKLSMLSYRLEGKAVV